MPTLETRIQSAIANTLHNPYLSIHVERLIEITPHFYHVNAVFDNHMMVHCLVFDTGNGCTVFMEPMAIHSLLTLPAMKQYTIEHPYLLGV